MDSYVTVSGEGVGEIEEKKSRFIATLRHVESEEEAQAVIAELKKKYWDARHNCSAYIIGTDKPIERCSDDGEPSRTAGMPMLDILKGAGLTDVVAVVTRYFGGVLLGTGGLVRAYQGAVRAGLEGSRLVTRRLLNRVQLTTDYNGYSRLQYFAEQDGVTLRDTEFTDKVITTVYVDDEQLKSITRRLTEATAGKCGIDVLGKEYVTDGL